MKKKLVTIMIASMAALTIGCSSNEESKSDENSQVKENINLTDSKESTLSQDELYNLHKELFPQIQQLFKDEGIDFVLDTSKKNTKYNEDTYAGYSDSANKEIGAYTIATYEVKFEENGDIRGIGMDLYQNIDSEAIKNNGFKFEDTAFYKMANIAIKENKDYSEINEKINNMLNNGEDNRITTTYENINENISVSSNEISYSINIKP